MRKKKIGIALGSGGARSLAHIGVIKELEKMGVEIDVVVGSSAGALIGGLYCALGSILEVEKLAKSFSYDDWYKTFTDVGLGLGVLKGIKAEGWLRGVVGEKRIEDLDKSFVAVATDLISAETIKLDSGDLSRAIRASGSVPLIFHPVKMEGRYLVDGGISAPVPVEIAREKGADFVLAVNLDSVYFLPENRKKQQISGLSVMKNTLFSLKYHLAEKECRGADLVINPEIPYVMDLDFVNKDKIIEGGEKAVGRVKTELLRLLGD